MSIPANMPAFAVGILKDLGLDKSPITVGRIYTHPDGRRVKILSGQYWGTHGLSNHWSWVEVNENGRRKRGAKTEHGYGWR